MLYLDSSAAVKLYVVEPGTDQVRAAIAADSTVVSVRLTFVEVLSALAAAGRAGRILDPEAAAAQFRASWQLYLVMDVDQLLVEMASALAARHALRAYDAVQLGAALTVAAGDPAAVRFATFDQPLARAATAEGLLPGV